MSQINKSEPCDSKSVNSIDGLIVEMSDIDTCKYLQISSLNEWDYPIFEAASIHGSFVLSKVRRYFFNLVI